MAEKAVRRGALEAARGALLALHASSGLSVGASREATHLLRAAEGLARAAIAVLHKEETAPATVISDGQPQASPRRRRRPRGRGDRSASVQMEPSTRGDSNTKEKEKDLLPSKTAANAAGGMEVDAGAMAEPSPGVEAVAAEGAAGKASAVLSAGARPPSRARRRQEPVAAACEVQDKFEGIGEKGLHGWILCARPRWRLLRSKPASRASKAEGGARRLS